MSRLAYGVLSLFIFSMLLLPIAIAQDARDVTLTNTTSKTLCVYAGNNVLTCHFIPKARIKLEIPIKVFYDGASALVDSITVTNAGGFVENADGSRAQQNLTLYQKRAFTEVGSHQWQVQEGKETGCIAEPVYPGDSPNESNVPERLNVPRNLLNLVK